MITAKNGEIRAEGSVRELLTDTAGIVSVGLTEEGEVKEFSAVGVAPWMK